MDALRTDERVSTERALGIAALAVVAVALWNFLWSRVLLDAFGVVGTRRWEYLNPLGYPGGETIFVESVVALGFPFGVAVSEGDRRGLLVVGGALLLAFLVDLVLGFVGAVSGIFGVFLLVFSADLLGVPMLGAVFVVAAFVLGFGHRRLLRLA